QFRQSEVFEVKIPFAENKTLGDVFDLSRAFADKVTNLLEPAPGSPNFDTAQQLASRLAGSLGLDPEGTAAHYHPLPKEPPFHVSFNETRASVEAPINFPFDPGPLQGLSADVTGTVGLEANVATEFVFGIDLSPLAPGTPLADHFFIEDASLSGTVQLR